MLATPSANFDGRSDPIPAILDSPEYRDAVRSFASSPSIKNALVSPDAQALLYCLIRKFRPKVAVEIGTYLASTTEAMARAVADNGYGILHTVDPFAIKGYLRIATWPRRLRKVTQFHLRDSMRWFGRMKRIGLRTDIVFVDGNHDYEFALFDIQSAAKMMNPGGFIVIDNIAQPGPFLAARDFMERAHSLGWRECGNSLARLNEPFDRHRTTIHNTDFCVLRAPDTIAVGSDPVGFGNLLWTDQSSGLKLRLQNDVTGRLQAQFIIRVFEAPQFREVIHSGGIELHQSREANIAIPFPLADKHSDRAVETWLTWQGTGDFRLSELPAIY
jgi:predicted O-methyltransferase YrrM